MMDIQITSLWAAVILAMMTLVVPASADVINDFEGSAGNAVDWNGGSPVSIDDASINPSVYDYEAAIGVTAGSQSLRLTQCGYVQTLAFQLDAAQRAVFMENSYFSIDVTVAASGGTYASGYTNIEEVAMNAAGPGWTAVASGTPLQFYWWGSAPERTQTLIVDYSDFRDAITNTGYIEIILTTNNGGGAPCDIYFDNAQLYGGLGELRAYEQEVLADGPVLYLRLEDDSPIGGAGHGPLIDSSGNGYWAVHRADTELRTNEGIGNCRYLPGTGNQNAIAAGNTTTFDWTFDFSDDHAFAPDDITFEFWFNTTAQTPTDANGLGTYGVFFQQVKADYDQAPGMSNSDGVFRVLNGHRTVSDPNVTEFWWYPNVEVPTDGQWHQVVLIYDESYGGDDNQMQIQLYVDGEFQASTVVGDAEWPAQLGPEFDHVCIGGANDLGYTYSNYTGLIDEFAIYQAILSADRIGIHYGAGLCEMSKGDLTGDCKVTLDDFAVIAANWLVCNDPALFISNPEECGPTW